MGEVIKLYYPTYIRRATLRYLFIYLFFLNKPQTFNILTENNVFFITVNFIYNNTCENFTESKSVTEICVQYMFGNNRKRNVGNC